MLVEIPTNHYEIPWIIMKITINLNQSTIINLWLFNIAMKNGP